MKKSIKKLLASYGYEIKPIPKKPPRITELVDEASSRKIHYACGDTIKEGWLNVDGYLWPSLEASADVLLTDLLYRHPFKDDFFEWGFCEDFIEHLHQADSTIFLAEAFRTLRPQGVFRLTFPSLDGQVNYGEKITDYESAKAVKDKYYTKYGHVHLYNKQEFEQLCRFIGFTKVEFKQFHESDYPELRNLEARDYVSHYNLYVELTK